MSSFWPDDSHDRLGAILAICVTAGFCVLFAASAVSSFAPAKPRCVDCKETHK